MRNKIIIGFHRRFYHSKVKYAFVFFTGIELQNQTIEHAQKNTISVPQYCFYPIVLGYSRSLKNIAKSNRKNQIAHEKWKNSGFAKSGEIFFSLIQSKPIFFCELSKQKMCQAVVN